MFKKANELKNQLLNAFTSDQSTMSQFFRPDTFKQAWKADPHQDPYVGKFLNKAEGMTSMIRNLPVIKQAGQAAQFVMGNPEDMTTGERAVNDALNWSPVGVAGKIEKNVASKVAPTVKARIAEIYKNLFTLRSNKGAENKVIELEDELAELLYTGEKKVEQTVNNTGSTNLGQKIIQTGEQKPTMQLKRDVTVTTLQGEKVVIPEAEVLKAYESGGKALLKDGREYIVSKSQYENIKNNSLKSEAVEFAPELKGTEETVLGDVLNKKSTKEFDEIIKKMGQYERGTPEYEKLKAQAEAFDKKLNTTPVKPKYSQYQLPGGENYREVLIKAPDTKQIAASALQKLKGKITPDEYQIRANEIVAKEPTAFKSSHWDEPNVISHLRLNERTYNGKKVTFMEELQSDWARELRSKGVAGDFEAAQKTTQDYFDTLAQKYGSKDMATVLDRKATPAEKAKYYELNDLANKAGRGIPNNPLLKNWQELSVKRALKEAVDNNSEYLAWTTGEQQAARYNLAKEVENIKWGDSNVHVNAKDKSSSLSFTYNDKGIITTAKEKSWIGKPISEAVGKGVAEKILAEPKGNLSGEGLNIGGEWAKNLYDRQVKSIVEDVTGGKVEMLDMGLPIEKGMPEFTDKLGHKLEKGALRVGKEVFNQTDTGGYIITDVLGDGKFKAVTKNAWEQYLDTKKLDKKYFRNGVEIEEALDKAKQTFDISTKKTTQQGIRLTPEIKAKIRGEAPKFKTGQEGFATNKALAAIGGVAALAFPFLRGRKFEVEGDNTPRLPTSTMTINRDKARESLIGHESRGTNTPTTTVNPETDATGLSQITQSMLDQYNKLEGTSLRVKDLSGKEQLQIKVTDRMIDWILSKYENGLDNFKGKYRNEVVKDFNDPVSWVAGEWVAGPDWVHELDNKTAADATETVRDYINRIKDRYLGKKKGSSMSPEIRALYDKFDSKRIRGSNYPLTREASSIISKNTKVKDNSDKGDDEYEAAFDEKREGKDEIEIRNHQPTNLFHEKVHAWIANTDYFESIEEQFEEAFVKEKSSNDMLQLIDKILNEDKHNYPSKDDNTEERYAYVAEAYGAGGLKAFPENLRRYYEKLLN